MNNASEFFEAAVHCMERGDKSSALQRLQAGLLLAPDNASAWANRGNILSDLNQPFEALVSLDRALTLAPNSAELHVNRSAALASLNMHDSAGLAVERALELDPKNSLALANKGNLHYLNGRYDEAAAFYWQAIIAITHRIIGADVDDLHLFRAMALLAAGHFKEGWSEFEARRPIEILKRNLPFPKWNGESGKTVLVVNEQGYGDALHFMRYAPILKQRHGGAVYLEVRQPLCRIARTMRGIDGVTTFGDPLPDGIEAYVSSMSLPHLLGTDSEAKIPGDIYLDASGPRAEMWREKLAKTFPGKFLIGLCWAGQARVDLRLQEIDARRSMSLGQFAPLAPIANIAFASLQVGQQAAQAFDPPARMTIANWSHEIEDFYDTAALIECLDLVIAVDTAVVHLAGALGKPVWLLSRFDNCWRWLGDREDSPWYPSLRQFRQPSWGNWASVIDHVAVELHNHALRKAA